MVKGRRQTYLPATQTMKRDGVDKEAGPGWEAYVAYITRAIFPTFVRDATEAMVGVMWSKPPVIELPPELEPLRELASSKGESLEMLLRRVNEAQLAPGRIGILLDLPTEPTPNPLPYLVTYETETIINWDEGQGRAFTRPGEMNVRDSALLNALNLVVLDESGFERVDDFDWEHVQKHRVLILGETDVNEPREGGFYRTALFRDEDDFNEEALFTPHIREQPLNKIPFVFVNSKDILPEPDDPPLHGLASLAMAVYRGEADYNQNLFLQGQDTPVVIGGSEGEYRLGAGSFIEVPIGGDAKFIGVSADGLGEQRMALENNKLRAAQMGAQLLDSRVARESGQSLKVRVAAKTATLTSVALTGAFALERILKMAAEWMGADASQVRITPNLDFAEAGAAGQELVELMTARAMGAPISLESIHDWLREREVTTKTYDEELKTMEGEPAPGPAPGTPMAGAQGGASNSPRVVTSGLATPNGDENDED